jgi:hypothetical protein
MYAGSTLCYSKDLTAGVYEFSKFFFHYVTAVALRHMTTVRSEKAVKEAKVNWTAAASLTIELQSKQAPVLKRRRSFTPINWNIVKNTE